MKYCPNCGSDLTEGAKFCPACGYMISEYRAASEPLPEKEIFPEPGSKKTEDFGFEVKSEKYDPFNSDAAPRYSDYASSNPFDSESSSAEEGSSEYDSAAGSSTGTYGAGYAESSSETRSYDSYSSSYSSERSITSETNGYAIAALVLGIIALLFDVLLFIPSILAVIFGVIGLKRSEETGTGRGMSIAGIVLGIIAFSIYLVIIICAFVFTGVLVSL